MISPPAPPGRYVEAIGCLLVTYLKQINRPSHAVYCLIKGLIDVVRSDSKRPGKIVAGAQRNDAQFKAIKVGRHGLCAASDRSVATRQN